jgi:hypothetical protein
MKKKCPKSKGWMALMSNDCRGRETSDGIGEGG